MFIDIAKRTMRLIEAKICNVLYCNYLIQILACLLSNDHMAQFVIIGWHKVSLCPHESLRWQIWKTFVDIPLALKFVLPGEPARFPVIICRYAYSMIQPCRKWASSINLENPQTKAEGDDWISGIQLPFDDVEHLIYYYHGCECDSSPSDQKRWTKSNETISDT